MAVSSVFSWVFAIWSLCAAGFIADSAAAQDKPNTLNIIHAYRIDAMHNVKVQYQYTGSITAENDDQQDQPRVFPLDTRILVNFDQRVTNASANSAQAVRVFDQAKAEIKAGRGATSSKLSSNNELILARIKSNNKDLSEYQFASVADTLTQREYELVKNPADPLTFHRVFNKKNAKVGDKWKVGESDAASFLALDRIISSELFLSLESVKGGVARIFVSGIVKGEIDDAIAEMKVNGLATLDLATQQITALRMDIETNRRVGQVAPGFDGQVKIDLSIRPINDNPRIDRQALNRAYRGKKVRFTFKVDQENSDFTIDCDPRWRVIASEKEGAILRYIDDGQLLAQCNVVQLPDRPVDKPLKLEEFKLEVGKIISQSQAKIVNASESQTPNGLNALRLLVSGIESNIPVNWLYYHLTSSDGRRLTVVFTLEQDVADEFGDADRSLVEQVRFKPQAMTQAQQNRPTKNR